MLQTLSDTVRSTFRATRRTEIESLIRHYSFPYGLRRKVAARLCLDKPDAIEDVLLGLKDYLALCLEARGMVLGMPSKAVDAAWHEFILYTRDYTYFCERAFGNYLHHIPNDEPSTDDDFYSGVGRAWMDLGRTWILSCIRADTDPKQPTAIPRLFAIDAELGLPDGEVFTLESLAALPTPPGFIETEPGRYRYIAPKKRKRAAALFWVSSGTSGGSGSAGAGCGGSAGGGSGCGGSSGCGCGGGGGGCGGGGGSCG
jgi:hypothetical protein